MGTLVDSDIDSFIRGHKAKLQNERAQINQYTDQPRQAQGRQAPSPSNRKQWDRGQRTQPAVEARPQAQPEETGLKFGDGEQDRRKQQLQNERQQEYNDLIKGRLRANRRGPRTPSQEGLPLGQYEQKRKALDKERQLEMQKALEAKASGKPPKSKIFDYAEAEKAHMAEKRKEYNEYLEKKKRESKRHIVTPEDGMFVGPDQSDRNKQIREKSKANRIALEQQQREQLLLKARQMGHIPPHVPRNQVLPRKTEQGRGATDKLDLSPRQGFDGPDARRPTEPYGHQGNTQYDQNNYVSPKQKPLYLENGSDQPIRDERDDLYAGRGQYERGRARERGDGRDNRRHKSHDRQYDKYDRKLSPPLEVRKSRSLSPPTSPTPALRDLSPPPDRRVPQNDPEKLLEDQKRMLEDLKKDQVKTRGSWDRSGASKRDQYDPAVAYKQKQQEIAQRMYDEQMAERQQILAEEYRREVAEEQRIATEREGQGLAFHESNKQKLGEERKREYQEYLAQKTPRSLREKEPTPEDLRKGLPLDQKKYDQKKRQLETERQREYNELLKQQQYQQQKQQQQQQHYQPQSRGQGNTRGVMSAPQAGQYDDADETQQYHHYQYDNNYYNEKGSQGGKRQVEVLQGSGATLPVGEYDDHRRQQLIEERHREYNEQQQQQEQKFSSRQKGLPPKPPTPNHFFKNIGQHDRTAQMLNEERKKEYNQKLQEDRHRTAGRGPDYGENNTGGLPLKGTDSAEVKLGKDYATLPGLHYTNSPEVRKIKTRNAEYNEFLKDKQYKDAHRFDKKKPPQGRHSEPTSPRDKNKDVYGTLPGLHYSDSAEKRKIQERNREYNDYMKQKQGKTRKGWTTPTYEEILEQKRREEALRRQEDEYASSNLRRHASEGAINNLQNDYRAHELDTEFEARNEDYGHSTFRLERSLSETDFMERRQKLLNLSQDFESIEPPRQEIREDMAVRVQPLASLPVGGAPGVSTGHDESGSAQKRRKSDYRRELELQMEENRARKQREKKQDLKVNASGLLDPEKSWKRVQPFDGPAKPSPRREYKANSVQPYHTKFLLDDSDDHDALGRGGGRDQQTRTAPSEGGGRVARAQDFGISNLNSLGLGSSDQDEPIYHPSTAPTLKGILSRGDHGISRYLTPSPVVYSDYGDDLRLDLGGGGGGGGRERGRRRERDTSLLDPGFTGLLESRRNVGVANPPPGLMYQPSFGEILDVPSANPLSGTYVTGGAGGLAGPYSSIDEAYHYYGMKNPLDVENGAGGGGGGGGGLPNLNLGYNDYDRPQVRGSPTPRVTFADDPPTARRRDRSKERISPYQFPSDDDLRSRSRNDTQSYGAELERQIQEKRMQKMREKEEQDRYERKLEEDIKNYNPFGRGGGGAPIKDEGGNAIADLRSLQRGTYQSPRQQQLSHRRQLSPEYSPRPSSPRDDKIGPPPIQQTALGETTHARGGHGIFGQPKTEAEKDQSDKYKDELRQQIAEKRRRAEMEKERERMEEQKEEKRLEEQRLRMQSEYEEEQKKIRAREEEARRKNEELKKQADERKKDAERKRREADDARMREQQEQIEREKREQQQREERERVKSPPVPAVKAKTSDDRGTLSPPLPAQRRGRDSPSAVSVKSHRSQPTPAQEPPSSNRPNSSDVLTQLASMRKQLQNERKRVENALENSKNEPDVFDPRTIQRPPPNKLIFENAVNKNASLPPQRAQTTDMANARNIQQFNELKNKTDTDSRRAFRSMFPDAPVTNTTLEAQQDAMIRQQEEQLRSLRERNVYDPTPSNLSFGRRPGNISARSQLASNSAFIDVEGINHFPEDFEDMAGARNDSARARRRAGYSPRPPSGMGSQASLDVDRIQRKNEERLRRLNQMSNTGDDISMGDPDDILDRFMAKQRYNRPPSGQTLQDDSWLRPGSKVV